MKWFIKQKGCAECGVLFEEPKDHDPNYRNYCSVHRKPLLDLANRKRRVEYWAGTVWERLEPMMIKEQKEQTDQNDKIYRENINRQACTEPQGLGKNPYAGLGLGNILGQKT